MKKRINRQLGDVWDCGLTDDFPIIFSIKEFLETSIANMEDQFASFNFNDEIRRYVEQNVEAALKEYAEFSAIHLSQRIGFLKFVIYSDHVYPIATKNIEIAEEFDMLIESLREWEEVGNHKEAKAIKALMSKWASFFEKLSEKLRNSSKRRSEENGKV